ncbi:MAG TPA: hypothetical protein GXZ60_09295 [Intrasporangiaceae bacterium]|nr:hypothetical protein [Intrasporangiaceae bacterium]
MGDGLVTGDGGVLGSNGAVVVADGVAVTVSRGSAMATGAATASARLIAAAGAKRRIFTFLQAVSTKQQGGGHVRDRHLDITPQEQTLVQV